MPITRDQRGNIVGVDEAIRPAQIADVLAANDAADLRYETAQDAVHLAQRKVKPAAQFDADERRKAVAAGKELPKNLSPHEAAALSDVERAKAERQAALELTGPAGAAARRAIRENLPEIEAAAKERAIDLGTQYRDILRQAIAIRVEYVDGLTDWQAIGRERVHLFVDEQSKLAGRRVDAPRHWWPTPDGMIGRTTNPTEALDDLLREDSTRHIGRPARFKSEAERVAWEGNLDNPDAWDFDGRPATQSAPDFEAKTDTAGGRSTQVYV